MLFDHAGLGVKDLAVSRAFYERALKPLGVGVVMDFGEAIGIGELAGGGEGGSQTLWLGEGKAGGHVHVAFVAATREAVDAFYSEALAAGGTDNGPPGIRERYSPTYYAAFVLDPEGHNIEAVCQSEG